MHPRVAANSNDVNKSSRLRLVVTCWATAHGLQHVCACLFSMQQTHVTFVPEYNFAAVSSGILPLPLPLPRAVQTTIRKIFQLHLRMPHRCCNLLCACLTLPPLSGTAESLPTRVPSGADDSKCSSRSLTHKVRITRYPFPFQMRHWSRTNNFDTAIHVRLYAAHEPKTTEVHHLH